MKEWVLPILISGIASLFIRVILPKGEKSPLYPSLKFLISLGLTLSILSPLISFSKKDPDSLLPQASVSAFASENGQETILSTCQKDMENAVRLVFPDEEVSLELKAGEDFVPIGIHLICEKEDAGQKIAAFLEKNFSLITTVEIKGGSYESGKNRN